MLHFPLHHTMPPLFCLCLFFTFSIISLTLLMLLYTHNPKNQKEIDKPIIKISSLPHPHVDIAHKDNEKVGNYDYNIEKFGDCDETHEPEPTRLTRALILQTLKSNPTEWDKLLSSGTCDEPGRTPSGQDEEWKEEDDDKKHGNNKKRKKRAKKKKKPDSDYIENNIVKGEELGNGEGLVGLECPFTTSCSATQRKIKQQYEQLVKSHSHQSNGLTLTQIADFISCLMEARNELQHKSKVIKRKFTITKALLLKADRSSFDRLCQQIFKLETEQKRLEEDASVYNWLHQQIKLSPAYMKLLQFSVDMELKEKSGEIMETTDDEFSDISFEELLAQEKKDVFWQRHAKPKQFSR